MFRKPKRKRNKDGLRKRTDDEVEVHDGAMKNSDEEGDATTSDLISEARKRLNTTSKTASSSIRSSAESAETTSLTMHTYETKNSSISTSDLATRAAGHLPSKEEIEASKNRPATGRGEDGIYRDTKRNKFLAGPIKASQNIRVTARFDYQPDICKDYKDTGFCGFGDTCIYLHDRGDTLTGWQLEAQWEEEQRRKKEKQEKEITQFLDGGRKKEKESGSTFDTDGLPFACHVCREYFKAPIVTNCGHYFCHECIMDHFLQGVSRGATEALCPICQKDTHSVFHEPVKLLAKKKRVLGAVRNKEKDSWKLFYEALSNPQQDD